MTFDYRASQLRTSKIIASGSTGTGAKLLLYPIDSQGTPLNQGNISPALFGTGSIGNDVFFFVSGAIGSINGSSNGASVFGGDVYVSGNLKSAGDFGPIKTGTVTTFISSSTGLVWQTTLGDYEIQNINLSLIGKQTNNTNYAKFNREFTLVRTTGSVAFADSVNVYTPDFQTTGSWGFSLALSASSMSVYVTGSMMGDVFWKCQATVNALTSN